MRQSLIMIVLKVRGMTNPTVPVQ